MKTKTHEHDTITVVWWIYGNVSSFTVDTVKMITVAFWMQRGLIVRTVCKHNTFVNIPKKKKVYDETDDIFSCKGI